MIKPYYNEDGITIYNADALNVCQSLDVSVRAVITDPPYASGARTEAQKNSSGAMLRGQRWAARPIENDQMTTTGFIWLMREMCYAVRDLIVDGGSLLAFIDWRQWPNLVGAVESTNLRVNQMVVWDKLNYGLGNGFRSQHELILHASKGVPEINSKATGNVLKHKRDDNTDHPSPKPVALISKLIEVVSEPDTLILDPFMGAGSTLIAAKKTGRRAIGVEISEHYCQVAVERLRQNSLFSVLPSDADIAA